LNPPQGLEIAAEKVPDFSAKSGVIRKLRPSPKRPKRPEMAPIIPKNRTGSGPLIGNRKNS
jgi:hypothetical protein